MACLPRELQRGKAEKAGGLPVHFSVEKLGHMTCHMIALSTCPSSSVAGPTFG